MKNDITWFRVYEVVWTFYSYPDNERKTHTKHITAESFLHALGIAEKIGLNIKPRLRTSDITKIEFLHAVEHTKEEDEESK